MPIIFETERLKARRLILNDFDGFHEMQSNINVMRYVRGKAMTYQENKQELPSLIEKYEISDNDFWIFAVERKSDGVFVGTVALVKDQQQNDEIGYRLLERFWNNGYGYEIAEGLVTYCKKISLPKIIASVVQENVASTRILQKLGFEFVREFVSEDLKLPEYKFVLKL